MVNLSQDMNTANGRVGAEHIPYQPFWIVIVRGFQLVRKTGKLYYMPSSTDPLF